ncbi:hypothetical protein [Haloprofundus salinisoli]|uniref:hypothetical protein n=1 Tax=Haloprofundus salinisoli TaxID=2876193 RepID=UPI001CCCF7B0|nr:hypothetical protein [Haloprofundus salinisoli]
MYLEIYELRATHWVDDKKFSEVQFEPYSYTYDGWNDAIADYLATEPRFGKVVSAPESAGAPEMREVTDERERLIRLSGKLVCRGASRCEIVDE